MLTVGIREIKNRLSEYLRKAKAGERILVTERGKPVAIITRPGGMISDGIETMIRERQASWGGGKPQGARNPPKLKRRSVADAVIEDRR